MRRFLSARWREPLRLIEFMLERIEIALDEIKKKEPEEPVESLSKYVKETPGSDGRRYSLYSE